MEDSREFEVKTRVHTPQFMAISRISINYTIGKKYKKYGPLSLSIENISNDNYLVCGKGKVPHLHYITAIKKGNKIKVSVSTEKGNSQKLLEGILDYIQEEFTED